MKHVFLPIGKALFTLAVCIALSTSSGAQVAVQPYGSEVPGPIRYTGTNGDMLQFDVSIPGVASRAVLRIFDEKGVLLHEEFLSAGNFHRRYKVPTGLAGKLRFEVAGKDLRVKQVFDIARQMEERVVVTASL